MQERSGGILPKHCNYRDFYRSQPRELRIGDGAATRSASKFLAVFGTLPRYNLLNTPIERERKSTPSN